MTMNSDIDAVEAFIYEKEGQQQSLLRALHELLYGHYELTTKIRYKIPFYYRKSWICYLNPIKNEGIELAFLRGNELSNAQGILDSKGRKQVYGIDLHTASDIPMTLLREILQEAILLDETVPYPSKRKK